jgi:hypothetical protein
MCSLNTERAIPHSENAGHWPCGKPRHSWKENMKINILEMMYEGGDWVGVELAQIRDKRRTVFLRI